MARPMCIARSWEGDHSVLRSIWPVPADNGLMPGVGCKRIAAGLFSERSKSISASREDGQFTRLSNWVQAGIGGFGRLELFTCGARRDWCRPWRVQRLAAVARS